MKRGEYRRRKAMAASVEALHEALDGYVGNRPIDASGLKPQAFGWEGVEYDPVADEMISTLRQEHFDFWRQTIATLRDEAKREGYASLPE